MKDKDTADKTRDVTPVKYGKVSGTGIIDQQPRGRWLEEAWSRGQKSWNLLAAQRLKESGGSTGDMVYRGWIGVRGREPKLETCWRSQAKPLTVWVAISQISGD